MRKSFRLTWLKFLILVLCFQLVSFSSGDEFDNKYTSAPPLTDAKNKARDGSFIVNIGTNTPPDLDRSLRDDPDDEVIVCAPEYDESFKFIFSPDTDDGKECLMDMLNAIYCNDLKDLDDKSDRGFRIRDAELLMNHKPTKDSVDLIFDIKCRLYLSDHDLTEHTETSSPSPVYYMDIEMQRKKQTDYPERMHKYNGRSITESVAGAVQPSKYDAISIDESNVKIRSVSFLKQSLRKDLFALFHEIPAFTNSFMVRGKVKRPVLEEASTDKVINTYAQLNKIKELDAKISELEEEAQEAEAAGTLDPDDKLVIENLKKTREWLSFINLGGHDARRDTKYRIRKSHFTNPVIRKALDRLVAFTNTKAYQDMVAQGDSEQVIESVMQAQRMEGRKEGLEEGRKEGIEEGKKEAKKEEKKEGAVNAVSMALMLKCTFDDAKAMAKKYYPDQAAFIDSLVLKDGKVVIPGSNEDLVPGTEVASKRQRDDDNDDRIRKKQHTAEA